MRAVFIGCVESSRILLQHIFENEAIEICGIVTKKISKINSDFFDLSKLVLAECIDTYFFEATDKDEVLLKWLRKKSPDIIFCFGWSHLVSSEVIATACMGAIGYHPTMLPANRGRHPIVWSLVLGLKHTASTFFMLEEGADVGNIVSQKEVPISESDNASSLYFKLMEVAKTQILLICESLSDGKLLTFPQDHAKANTWRKRREKDSEIDWRMSARNIYNLVRGLSTPYPGAFFFVGEIKVTVWDSECLSEVIIENIEPGKIVKVDCDGFLVNTGK